MTKSGLTALGVAAVVALIVGLLLLFLGSTSVVQVIGLVIALLALLAMLGGIPASKRMAAVARPQMDHDITAIGGPAEPGPDPEYVAANPEAPDSVWEHEEALYHEKQEREQHEHEERESHGDQQP